MIASDAPSGHGEHEVALTDHLMHLCIVHADALFGHLGHEGTKAIKTIGDHRVVLRVVGWVDVLRKVDLFVVNQGAGEEVLDKGLVGSRPVEVSNLGRAVDLAAA